eukprot:m.111387 g.111387  ORF g.111387 m.111387 type:complete len:274 (-) comp12763_c0_seq1:57-878(-)
MKQNSEHFKQFVNDEDFDYYLDRKSLSFTHGNHVEIQAASELYNRTVEVYSYDSVPLNIFQHEHPCAHPLRISYHNNNHYNAVFDPNHHAFGLGLGIIDTVKNVEEELVEDVKKRTLDAVESEQLNAVMEKSKMDPLSSSSSKRTTTNSSTTTTTSSLQQPRSIEDEILRKVREESLREHLFNAATNTSKSLAAPQGKLADSSSSKKALETSSFEKEKEDDRGDKKEEDYDADEDEKEEDVEDEDEDEDVLLQRALAASLQDSPHSFMTEHLK